jgi:hypothetical protein
VATRAEACGGGGGDRTEPTNLMKISISMENGGCVGRMRGRLVDRGLVWDRCGLGME